MLEIKNVSKCYVKGKKALSSVNLSIKEGDLFAFIGPNGSGKTTLIKSICGIHDFDEGEILLNGLSVKKDAFKIKEIIAYVPDNPDIYDFMTGTQYLNFVCDVYKIGKEDRQARIDSLCKLFEISKALNQKISTFSHGMKQKLVLVSALAHSPKLLILDEPFVGLDPKSSFELKNLMQEYCKKGGMIFFSTHVLEVAEKLCNKVAIIKAGKVVKSGTMKAVKGDESLEEIFLELSNE